MNLHFFKPDEWNVFNLNTWLSALIEKFKLTGPSFVIELCKLLNKGRKMNKLILILLTVLIGKIAEAQNAPYAYPFIELRILDASQTQCVLNYCPPYGYVKQNITPDITLSMWVVANPKIISKFAYTSCLGRSDESVYKAALYKRAWGLSNSPQIIERYNFSFQCVYHRSY